MPLQWFGVGFAGRMIVFFDKMGGNVGLAKEVIAMKQPAGLRRIRQAGGSSPIMRSHFPFRFPLRMLLCLALVAAASTGFGEAPPRKQTPARLLDQAALLCDNCFFGTSDYFYCFATDDAILIGYQRAPVVNWWDRSKNYASRLHPSWTALDAPTDAVRIEYDDKHIWVMRADQEAVQKAGGRLHPIIRESKDVRLVQNYKRDVFTNQRCQEAVRAKAH